jgi:uncharacterized iron-regulated membrane protein
VRIDRSLNSVARQCHGFATEAAITASFTDGERKRFQGLLRLAAESPFAGERANAFAAATRLAARHGLTVEEAAAGDDRAPLAQARDRRPSSMGETLGGRSWFADYDPPEVGRFMHLTDIAIRLAKMQHEAAVAEARARGLDAAAEAAARRQADRVQRQSNRRMNPRDHARVLLTETSLRLRDIVDITGLDIYQVVSLKLALRPGTHSGAAHAEAR